MDPYQYLAVAGIARTRPDMPIGVVVDGLSAGDAVGAWLTVTSGAASGRELISLGGGDDVIVAAGGRRNMSVGFEDVAARRRDRVRQQPLPRLHALHPSPARGLSRVRDVHRRRRADLPAATERDRFTRSLPRRAVPRRVRRQVHRGPEPPRRTVLAVWRARTCAGCSSSGADPLETCGCGSPSTRCTCRRRRYGPGHRRSRALG